MLLHKSSIIFQPWIFGLILEDTTVKLAFYRSVYLEYLKPFWNSCLKIQCSSNFYIFKWTSFYFPSLNSIYCYSGRKKKNLRLNYNSKNKCGLGWNFAPFIIFSAISLGFVGCEISVRTKFKRVDEADSYTIEQEEI